MSADDSFPNYRAKADRTEHSLVEKQDQAARNRKEEQVKANQASCHFTQSELLPGRCRMQANWQEKGASVNPQQMDGCGFIAGSGRPATVPTKTV